MEHWVPHLTLEEFVVSIDETTTLRLDFQSCKLLDGHVERRVSPTFGRSNARRMERSEGSKAPWRRQPELFPCIMLYLYTLLERPVIWSLLSTWKILFKH